MKSIILIDDDAAFVRVLGRNLETLGYKICSATCIAEVRKCLVSARPDFAVIDVHLQSESGMDALGLVRKLSPASTVVMLSGYIDIATAAEAARAGAADCLVKPLSVEELEHALLSAAKRKPDQLPTMMNPAKARLQHIVSRWEKNDRNTSKTAVILGMHRRTLQRILQNAGVVRDPAEIYRAPTRFEKLRRLHRVWSDALTTG
ncbi:response regulator [Anderseniella sp. Alg231-50]|uniref:response regulator n=1 Tax=Anderseniella sp. Alg231-50 TaxID=1922226 RepID=UPI000D55C2AF